MSNNATWNKTKSSCKEVDYVCNSSTQDDINIKLSLFFKFLKNESYEKYDETNACELYHYGHDEAIPLTESILRASICFD